MLRTGDDNRHNGLWLHAARHHRISPKQCTHYSTPNPFGIMLHKIQAGLRLVMASIFRPYYGDSNLSTKLLRFRVMLDRI